MITIISGTNRKGAKTHIFAKKYTELVRSLTQEDVHFLSLEDVPNDLLHTAMYSETGQSAALADLQDKYMIPAQKLVIISPEYNGSYPGVLKLFLDACSIRAYKETFSGKKVALLGVASGRAGNLRGMEHLTGVFNHVGATVMPNKLPISSIDTVLQEDDTIQDNTVAIMKAHAEAFLEF